MWRILQFLSRFGNFILVLVLELAAFLLIITLNKPHREISQGVFMEFSGTLGKWQTAVKDYFNLATQNERLQHQNADLQAEILSLRDTINTYRHGHPHYEGFMLLPDSVRKDSLRMAMLKLPGVPDSLLPVQGFSFIPCRAVNSTVRLNYNYITLNKGSLHGVRKDMVVISPQGIAGQVIGVSKNYSLALSVLNKKFRVSAEILRNNNVGTLTWEGLSPEEATLDFIPQTSKIRIGDTVVTTGYGTVFPPDYFVGTVRSYNTDAQDGFYHIDVRLATNFNSLHHLFLVDFKYKHEIDALDTLKAEQ